MWTDATFMRRRSCAKGSGATAVGGVIGSRKLAFDLWGDTVNVASRLEGLSQPGRILVREATWDLVRDKFQCEAQADSELRGHATVRTYSILGPARAAEKSR